MKGRTMRKEINEYLKDLFSSALIFRGYRVIAVDKWWAGDPITGFHNVEFSWYFNGFWANNRIKTDEYWRCLGECVENIIKKYVLKKFPQKHIAIRGCRVQKTKFNYYNVCVEFGGY